MRTSSAKKKSTKHLQVAFKLRHAIDMYNVKNHELTIGTRPTHLQIFPIKYNPVTGHEVLCKKEFT